MCVHHSIVILQSKEVTTLKHRLTSQEEEVAMARTTNKNNQQLQEVSRVVHVRYIENKILP